MIFNYNYRYMGDIEGYKLIIINNNNNNIMFGLYRIQFKKEWLVLLVHILLDVLT